MEALPPAVSLKSLGTIRLSLKFLQNLAVNPSWAFLKFFFNYCFNFVACYLNVWKERFVLFSISVFVRIFFVYVLYFE